MNDDNISNVLKEMLDEMSEHVRTFYSQDDILKKLDQVYNARGGSDFHSLKSELQYMFEARNFPEDVRRKLSSAHERNFDRNYFRVQIIRLAPSKTNLITTLFKGIYNLYLEFPPAERFMSRIVKRLTNNEFPNNSLRMKILKRFVRYTDFHTRAIELRTITATNRSAYEKLSRDQQRNVTIDLLTEDIFSRPNVNFDDWLRFFRNRAANFPAVVPFATNTTDPEEIERTFLKYLSGFNVVKDGEIICSRDELYRKEKVAFLKERGDIFTVLNQPDGVGNLNFLKMQEYATFLAALVSKNKNLADETWLSPNTKTAVVKLVWSIMGNRTLNKKTPIVHLLNQIANPVKKEINSSNKRVALLKELEEEFLQANLIAPDDFKQMKRAWLLTYHEKDIDDALKEKWIGHAGGDEQSFRDFLEGQIKSNKPAATTWPAVLTQEMGTAESFNEQVISYLKQFRTNRRDNKSFGHIYARAWKDFRDNLPYMDMTLMKAADNLASANFDLHGGTKRELYLFAFAFNMGFSTVNNYVHPNRDVTKNLFRDFYTDNFMRNNEQPTGEGINFKNYVEVSFLWWLNKTELPTNERLSRAEQFVNDVFQAAIAQAPNAITRILNQLPLQTKVYRDNFFSSAIFMQESAFKSYLLENYRIYSDDNTENNKRIMMSSDMRTAKKYIKELVDKIKAHSLENTDDYIEKDTNKNKKKCPIPKACASITIDQLIKELQKIEDDPYLENVLADDGFVSLLKKMENTLDVERILRNERFFDSSRYSRMDLIALYYFYFTNFVIDNAIVTYEVTDWRELTNEFLNKFYDEFNEEQRGLNSYLAECGFQLFSPKLLYDNFILFFLFLEIVW